MSILNALVCGVCGYLVACFLVVNGETRRAREVVSGLAAEMEAVLYGEEW